MKQEHFIFKENGLHWDDRDSALPLPVSNELEVMEKLLLINGYSYGETKENVERTFLRYHKTFSIMSLECSVEKKEVDTVEDGGGCYVAVSKTVALVTFPENKQILPTVSLQDGDTAFYSNGGVKIIHKDGSVSHINSSQLSVNEAAHAHYKFGSECPIGSRDRSLYEHKKESFLAGVEWMKSQNTFPENKDGLGDSSRNLEEQERLWRNAIDLVDTTCDYETIIQRLSERYTITKKP